MGRLLGTKHHDDRDERLPRKSAGGSACRRELSPLGPQSLEETGLATSMIESLILKHLAVIGSSSGRGLAKHVCLPFGILEGLLQSLRSRQIIVHTGPRR